MQTESDRFWRIILPLVLAEMTCALESNMLYSALASFYKTFNDPVGVGWLITSFLLLSAAAAAVCGRLGDLFGRSGVLLIMLGVALIGSVVSALAPSLNWIIAGRALQGASMAILPLCFGIVRENLPPKRMAFAVGLLGGTYTVGCAIGYVLGGVVVDRYSWPWLFWTSASLAALAAASVALFVPRSPRLARSGSLDMLGGVLFVPAVAMVLLAITKAKDWGWGNPATLALLGGGLVVLAAWIWHELRHPQPLIDVRLFSNRKIALGNLSLALGSFGGFQVVMVTMLLIQQPPWTGVGLGVTATFAAALNLPGVFAAAGSQVWAGHVAGRHGARSPLIVGAIILVVGTGGLALFHDSLWIVAALLILSLPGQGILFSAIPNLIIEAAPHDRTSEATGLSQVIKSVFMAVGAQMVSLMLATSTVSDPSRGKGVFPTDQAFTLTLGVMGLSCALCLAATLALPRRLAAARKETPLPTGAIGRT